MRPNSREITDFIIDRVKSDDPHVVKSTSEKFGVTRQSVANRLRILVARGLLTSNGLPRNARRYKLNQARLFHRDIRVHPGLQEDLVWEEIVVPALGTIGLPKNVMRIWQHGITEMVNNVVDHSASETLVIFGWHSHADVSITVRDQGVGIFKKIKDSFALVDERQSILELSKGKLTTDPDRHSGEGIFFTSRAFDEFSITSGKLFFSHTPKDDWLIEPTSVEETQGTAVCMHMGKSSATVLKDVFDKYAPDVDTLLFSKTHVPLLLASLGPDGLVSRSQAKRVLARVERFEEVLLDFGGVESIGQAFADEIFRVFRNQNPQVKVIWIRASQEVEKMINHVAPNWGKHIQ